jgi:stage V sporulation protein D (sporulation-specific penicillin-binding protein)
MSFGQRFTVTPIQMITAISAIANDGVLMQPRVVKEITNKDTGAVTTIDPVEVRQVISKETAEEVKSMMESVVIDGSGKHAAVTGYSIGGKSGTSEPLAAKKSDGYIASFVAITPVEDTKLVILVALYDPQGSQHQGGEIAAPVVSQMLSEILPIMGIQSSTTSDNSDDNTTAVPNVTNKTVTEAIKILENAGFNAKINVSGDANTLLVTSQVPVAGTQLLDDATVMLYSEENDTRTSVTVPDLKGMTAAQATSALKDLNLNISIEGSGYVTTQDYSKGTAVEEGTVISVTLKGTLSGGY